MIRIGHRTFMERHGKIVRIKGTRDGFDAYYTRLFYYEDEPPAKKQRRMGFEIDRDPTFVDAPMTSHESIIQVGRGRKRRPIEFNYRNGDLVACCA